MASVKWTRSALEASARKYSTVKEWRLTEPSAYATASRLKLLPELTADMHKKAKHGYWTAEIVAQRAKPYLHKRDWIRGDYSSYTAAQRLGIVDSVSGHMTPLGNRHKRCLYSIEVLGQNLVYIGLTYDFKKRIRDHMKSKRFRVLVEQYGKGCIDAVQITDYIDKEEASIREGILVKEFRQKGYQLLNIQKTGSLGGNVTKWTRASILEDAKNYSRVMEWANAPQSGYPAASAMGILDECTAHMERMIKTPGTYVKQDIVEAAAKFTQISEWVKKEGKTYAAAQRMQLLDDPEVVGHFVKNKVVNKKWTKDRVLKEAARFQSVSEWKRVSPGSYKAAKSDGYYDEIKSRMSLLTLAPTSNHKWTLESIRQDARKYETKTEWRNRSGGAYQAAKRLGVIEEVCSHMTVLNPKGRWARKEAILCEARKYTSRSQWQSESSGSYEAAKKKGIFEEAAQHMRRPEIVVKWDSESIRNDALKFSSKTQWARQSPGAYEAAKKRQIFEEVTSHMTRDNFAWKWNQDAIRDDAQKYLSKSEWKRSSIGAYTAAKKQGIFEMVTTHM